MCGVAGRDKVGEVNALHGFVRDQIVFRNDARGIEVVAYPTETMKMQSGDCDDKVVLLCALLESCGHTTRFITCSQNQNGQFTHVYPEVLLGGQWFALETVRRVPFGATPNGVTRREIHEY
jgi:transglutaminase-like putative cysteine protease